MNGSKVVFSEDFIEKTKLKTNPRAKSKLIKKKLHSLTPEDFLKLTSREDVAHALGYTDENLHAGVQVVGRLIRTGQLNEEFSEYNGFKKVNSYYLPINFNKKSTHRASKTRKSNAEVKQRPVWLHEDKYQELAKLAESKGYEKIRDYLESLSLDEPVEVPNTKHKNFENFEEASAENQGSQEKIYLKSGKCDIIFVNPSKETVKLLSFSLMDILKNS